MNRPDPLAALARRRARQLLRNLPSAQAGNTGALHRTRVASRRMREVLPLLGGSLAPTLLERARRETRRLTEALGRVREIDVALDSIRAVRRSTPARALAVERVRTHLLQERESRRQEMIAHLESIRPSRIVQPVSPGQLAAGEPSGWPDTLATRIARRAGRLREAIRHAGRAYVPDRLHAVRIRVKKLRYALEVAGEARVMPTGRAVRLLKQVQDILGGLHDLQILSAYVHTVAGVTTGDDLAVRELIRLGGALERECHRQHARYLARRAALVRLAARLARGAPAGAGPVAAGARVA